MTIKVAFPDSEPAANGLTVIKGQTRLQVSAGPDVDFDVLRKEQFELYFFCDGKMLSEGPQQSLPASISIDTRAIANGEHFITVNLRTSEDHLGTCSRTVLIQN